MADTVYQTGDTEATLEWLSNLLADSPAEPTRKRPPTPDRNRAATANNARQAQATKRAKSQANMTTDEWLATLPVTGKQHFEQRYMMGGTGVSILIADGDITIYTHANERGVLDAMGLHKAPNHTKWFSVQTVEDFDAFCGYWMKVRAWAKYAALAPAPKAEETPAPAKLAMKVWQRKGDEYVECRCFGWAGADLRVLYPGANEQTLIPAIRLVEMLSSGELRIEGVMPEMYKRVPAPPPENDGPKRAPAPVRPEVAEVVDAVLAAGLNGPHVKFKNRFYVCPGFEGYQYNCALKVRNKQTGESVEVGSVFMGPYKRSLLEREIGKIVPMKRAASAA